MDRLYDSAIGALIQRFGRVNRKRGKGICDCNIFRQANETDKYIYNTEIVSKTLQAYWLGLLVDEEESWGNNSDTSID